MAKSWKRYANDLEALDLNLPNHLNFTSEDKEKTLMEMKARSELHNKYITKDLGMCLL